MIGPLEPRPLSLEVRLVPFRSPFESILSKICGV